MFVQFPSQLGGLDLARGAPQQLLAQLALELVEPLAHAGPAHVQARRGTAQIAGVDDVDQQGQGSQVHCQVFEYTMSNFYHNC
ncbi:hypothetical protein D3C78_1290660 [compost metagenome]